MAALIASASFQFFCLVAILQVSYLQAIAVTGNTLPAGYTRFENLDVAYKVHPERRTWAEAKEACLDEGAHLAIIDTMEKVRRIAGMKGFNVYVWTGISRTSVGDPWKTSGTTTPMGNIPWAPGKPYGDHNCLAVRGCNRGLSNEPCSSSLGFVCQMPLNEIQFGTIEIY